MIAFFGDTHGNLQLMYQHVDAWEQRTGLKIDLVVQTGDFGIYTNLGDFPKYLSDELTATHKTVFCRGNHEDQLWLLGKEGTEIVPNITFLGDGTVYDILGVRFGVCGGNYSYKSYSHRKWSREKRYGDRGHGMKMKYYDHIMPYMVEDLIDQQFDVLLTHEAPIGTGIQGIPAFVQHDENGKKLPLGCPEFNKLLQTVNPKIHVHGHHHIFKKTTVGLTTVYCLDKVDAYTPAADCMLVLPTGELCQQQITGKENGTPIQKKK